MGSNYKLLRYFQRNIKLMKFLGLFPHRTVLDDNFPIEEDGIDISFKKYFKSHTLKERTKINKIHLFYCIVAIFVKIIFFSVNGIVFIIIQKDALYDSALFVKVLVSIGSSLFFSMISILSIYFLIVNSVQTRFYKSILSFEYFENLMLNFIQSSNQRLKIELRHSPETSIETMLRRFKIIYILSCFALIGTSVTFSTIEQTEKLSSILYHESVLYLAPSALLAFFTFFCFLYFHMILMIRIDFY